MRRIIFSLILLYSANAFSVEPESSTQSTFTSLAVNAIFETQRVASIDGLIDFVDREEKISRCVDDYVKKQSKSYAKIVQNNLYDLIHNFDKITSKIYGRKHESTDIPYEDKIEILARIQCDLYQDIGTLK